MAELSAGKRAGLRRILSDQGVITIAALDHRESLRRMLEPQDPDSVSFEEMEGFKRKLVRLLADEVSGLLLDPVYGKFILPRTAQKAVLFCLETSGYQGKSEARETILLENWGVKQAKEAGAAGVKLLVYYNPQVKSAAAKQRKLITQVAEACQKEAMLFLLEPMSYALKENEVKEQVVLRTVDELKDLGADVLKLEFAGNKQACEKITQLIRVPWVLLSAGMKYDNYQAALRIACEAGASGMAVGRAVWQEFANFQGEERDRFLETVAVTRMRELVKIVNQLARPVSL
jgi:tagatose 1,6-diphosphate aldolase